MFPLAVWPRRPTSPGGGQCVKVARSRACDVRGKISTRRSLVLRTMRRNANHIWSSIRVPRILATMGERRTPSARRGKTPGGQRATAPRKTAAAAKGETPLFGRVARLSVDLKMTRRDLFAYAGHIAVIENDVERLRVTMMRLAGTLHRLTVKRRKV